MLFSNKFRSLSWCLHCWLWTSKPWLDNFLTWLISNIMKNSCLTHLFTMYSFSNSWKHQKTLWFSDIFGGYRKSALGTNSLRNFVRFIRKHPFLEGLLVNLQVCSLRLNWKRTQSPAFSWEVYISFGILVYDCAISSYMFKFAITIPN